MGVANESHKAIHELYSVKWLSSKYLCDSESIAPNFDNNECWIDQFFATGNKRAVSYFIFYKNWHFLEHARELKLTLLDSLGKFELEIIFELINLDNLGLKI